MEGLRSSAGLSKPQPASAESTQFPVPTYHSSWFLALGARHAHMVLPVGTVPLLAGGFLPAVPHLTFLERSKRRIIIHSPHLSTPVALNSLNSFRASSDLFRLWPPLFFQDHPACLLDSVCYRGTDALSNVSFSMAQVALRWHSAPCSIRSSSCYSSDSG